MEGVEGPHAEDGKPPARYTTGVDGVKLRPLRLFVRVEHLPSLLVRAALKCPLCVPCTAPRKVLGRENSFRKDQARLYNQ